MFMFMVFVHDVINNSFAVILTIECIFIRITTFHNGKDGSDGRFTDDSTTNNVCYLIVFGICGFTFWPVVHICDRICTIFRGQAS